MQEGVLNNNTKLDKPTKKYIMRTLNTDQVTEKMSTTKAFAWNSKRRYRK